jgi:hypothetical protein
MFLAFFTNAQSDFKWDVRDSVALSKDEIYSKVKEFVGVTWKSAQDVIQVDDKDGGMVLIKGIDVQEMNYQMNEHRWTFGYTIKFMFKDQMWRIVIENVSNTSARAGTYDWPILPITFTYPEKGYRETSLKEDRFLELMGNVYTSLQGIIDSFEAEINQMNTDDW